MIKVGQRKSIFDRKLRIAVEALVPKQKVTLENCVEIDNGKYTSHAKYLADDCGVVDCETSFSYGGSFKGCHPMGLFWSMYPVRGERPGLRFRPKGLEPVLMKLNLYDGWEYNRNTSENTQEPLGSVEIERLVLPPNVRRFAVKENDIIGSIFVPTATSGSNQHPGIIDLHGTAGGMVEYRAALMAAHGFTTFALGYFQHEGLPDQLGEVDLNYFEKAIEWFFVHPNVDNSRGIGVVGISLGADIAAIMATLSEKISAVVMINGFHMLEPFSPLKHHGQPLPIATVSNLDLSSLMEDEVVIYKRFREALPYNEDAVFKSKAKFLFIVSMDDQSTCAEKSAKILSERLKSEDRSEILRFHEAGHLLDPPYIPVCTTSYHRVAQVLAAYGGTPERHAIAQEKMWRNVQTFFAKNIGHLLKPNL